MYGIAYHIDHLIPVTWFNHNTPKYIVNDIRNLQVIDFEYNIKKNNRWADEVSEDYYTLILPYVKKTYISKLKRPKL
jgi:hypothetical protein